MPRKRPPKPNQPKQRTFSAFESGICHYCGDHAGTVDHVVPRSAFPQPLARQPYWFRSYNEVPCCKKCNNDKGSLRSDCTCDTCVWAWNTAMALFVKDGYKIPPIIKIVRSPG